MWPPASLLDSEPLTHSLPRPTAGGQYLVVLFTWMDVCLPADTYASYFGPWKSRNVPPDSPLVGATLPLLLAILVSI